MESIFDTPGALAYFDQLDPIPVEFMLGAWRGRELKTGHPMEGLLELVGWHGKQFEGVDDVHPLVMTDGRGFYKLDPMWVPMNLLLLLPRTAILSGLMTLLKPIVRTSRSRARLRAVEYRGKVSATMCYDQKPIHDVFRKIDQDTVMGLMDMKGWERPYFFSLERHLADPSG